MNQGKRFETPVGGTFWSDDETLLIVEGSKDNGITACANCYFKVTSCDLKNRPFCVDTNRGDHQNAIFKKVEIEYSKIDFPKDTYYLRGNHILKVIPEPKYGSCNGCFYKESGCGQIVNCPLDFDAIHHLVTELDPCAVITSGKTSADITKTKEEEGMKSRMTELQALEETVRGWDIIYRNGYKYKSQVPWMMNYANECPICEYMAQDGFDVRHGQCAGNCIMSYIWGGGHCEDPGSPYYDWEKTKMPKHAKIIQDGAAWLASIERAKGEVEKPYKERQKESGIEVGDYVKVVRKAKSHEDGWENSWNSYYMDNTIGQIGKVRNINDATGVWIEFDKDVLDIELGFPYFVLKKVEAVPFESVWIKHDGEGCPVFSDGVQVLYIMRNGDVRMRSDGKNQLRWKHINVHTDIMWYCVL